MNLPLEIHALIPTLTSFPIAVMITDCSGVAIWANPCCGQLIGYSVEEIAGQNAEVLESGDAKPRLHDVLQQVTAGGASWKGQSVVRRKNGECSEIELTITPIRDGAGTVTQALWTLQSISGQSTTAHKLAEESLRESEYWLRQSQRIAQAGSYMLDVVTGLWTSSEALDEVFGIGPEFLRDVEAWAELVHPEHRQWMADYFRDEVVGRGQPFCREYMIVRKNDGQVRWVDGRGELMCDGSGAPVKMLGTIQDITDRKRAEDALRASETRHRAIFESSRDAIFIADSETGMLVDANPAAQVLIGRPLEEIRTLHQAELHPTEDALLARANFERDRSEPTVTAHSVVRPDGKRIPVEIAATRMHAAGRQLTMGVFRDITERKWAEEALRESEERFRSTVEASPSGMYFYRLDAGNRLILTGANRSADRIIGISHQALLGKTIEEAFPSLADTEIPEIYRSVALGRIGTHAFEIPYRDERFDGWYAVSVFRPGTRTVAVDFVDITERKRVEEALQVRQWAIESSISAVALADLDGRLSYVNPAFVSMWGYDDAGEIIGRQLTEFWSGEDSAVQVLRAVLERGGWIGELEGRKKTGAVFCSQTEASLVKNNNGAPVCLMGSFVDVTERNRAEAENARLEARLMQAQKMESIGRLAGGVAHDFNNLLTVINGYSQMLLADPTTGDPVRAKIGEILKAGERAEGLTRQLLAYSRQQTLQPRKLDLSRVVRGMRSMLERLVGEDVQVSAALNAGAESVHADPHQLEQVVMNLAVNARDAMPGGGRLLIETANVELDESFVKTHPDVRAGRYVLLAVSDTGIGMDEKTQRRIFEPFFTTKEIGKGTGLGLSMVQGIVVQSGGHIEVYSEPGVGTTFKVYLPALPEAAAEVAKQEAAPAMGGKEAVLVVEDNEAVRDYAVSVLSANGYRVIQAGDGGEALLLSRSNKEDIDLVLTDIVMPTLGGRALAEELRKLQPGIKVLFMSGFAEDLIAQQHDLDKDLHFIQKPFSADQLATKVRMALGR